MSITYGPQGHAKRGVAPGGAGVGGGGVGSIIYDRVAPDSSYVQASGGTVNASDYPEYALSIGLPPIFGAKMAAPSFVPAGDTYYPLMNSQQNILSDDGQWFASCEAQSTAPGIAYIYRLVNGSYVLQQQINLGGTNQFSSNGSMAINNNGDLAVALQYNSFLYVYRNNGDGTWSSLTLPGYVTPQPNTMTWTRDSLYLIITTIAAPWLGALKMPASLASTTMTASTVTVSPVLSARASFINRNLYGDRWALSVGNTAFNVYDFNPTTLTFTMVNGSPGTTAISQNTSFSQDGTSVAVWSSTAPATFEVWSETVKGSGFKKTVSMPIAGAGVWTGYIFGGVGDSYFMSTYSTDGQQLFVLNGAGTYKAQASFSFPNQYTSFGTAISRDGSTMLSTYTGTSGNTQLFKISTTQPLLLPIPALQPQGYGPAKFLPFLKVRS